MASGSPDATRDDAELQRRLAEALSFMAHDARDGYATTLALMELQRVRTSPMPLPALVDRIERNAQRSLEAIDDFVEVAHARDRPLQPEPLDLADELVDAFANAWPAADARGVRLHVGGAQSAPSMGDRVLVRAALAKLVRDAVADAADGTDVECVLQADGARWVVEIRVTPAPETDPGGAAARRSRRAGLALATIVGERHAGSMQTVQNNDGSWLLRLELPQGGTLDATTDTP